MAASMSKTRADAYAQFRKWLGEQPYWLQDAAYRIYRGQKIEDKQIQTHVEMCVAEISKEQYDFNHIDDTEIEAGKTATRMAVLSLSDIVGVNALAQDARLDFSPEGVTVIYGLNGAGKSGFMRIFKQLSGNPYEEPIQPNVFRKAEAVQPSCSFRVCVNDEEQSTTCVLTGKANRTVLEGCDVFDTRISNAYINTSNNPSYQPFVFTVLSELSKVADRVSQKIRDTISSIKPLEIQFPSQLSFGEESAWVQSLSESTVIPAVFSTWTDEQEKRLAEIPTLLDAENVTQRLKLLRTQMKALSPIFDDLSAARSVFLSGRIKTTYEQYTAAKAKLAAAEKLFADSADDLDRISISSQDWKELWSIARRYYEALVYKDGYEHFGEEGSICPLCHQTITGATATRCQSVNEYINGSCSEDYKRALSALQGIRTSIVSRTYNSEHAKQALSGILTDDELETIIQLYQAFSGLESESDPEKAYALICAIDPETAVSMLDKKAKPLTEEITKLETAIKDEKRVELRHELNRLQCHKWIYDSMAAIQATVDAAKRKKKLSDALSLTQTNKITLETNRLAEALISAAYIERFTAELNRLAPSIKVKLEKAASRKGNSPYRVILDSAISLTCKTEDVLSEGEQRIVALAAFFADAMGRNESTPLIIDDPISSLDLNYETAATQRIVEIARERQVIVFTHRISMLTGIEEACQRLSVQHSENYIRSTARGKGVPDFVDVYRGDVKKHLTGIQQRILAIKKLDPDSSEYKDAVGKQCQQFRICVERSVEDILLQGMVHRFERRIMTNGKLTKLTRITDADCAFVDSMMTKYSFTEHSQPSDSPPIEIDIDDLNKDIGDYINWISEYRKRMQ